MMLRYIGNLKDKADSERKHLFNPFSCLADGVRWILWLPANVLQWCGFVSAKIGFRMKHNWLIKLITLIVTVIGLLASVVTVIAGWDQTVTILKNWFGG